MQRPCLILLTRLAENSPFPAPFSLPSPPLIRSLLRLGGVGVNHPARGEDARREQGELDGAGLLRHWSRELGGGRTYTITSLYDHCMMIEDMLTGIET